MKAIMVKQNVFIGIRDDLYFLYIYYISIYNIL